MSSFGVITRHATQDDIPLILLFLQKKAEFDESMGAFNGTLQATEEKLRKSLFCSTPFARVLFGEFLEQPISLALYYFRYSSFAAKPSLWLDDLYVNPEFRSKGVGSILMKTLTGIARKSNCTHLAWTASVNNSRGISFYQRIGAEIVDRQADAIFFRLDVNAVSSNNTLIA